MNIRKIARKIPIAKGLFNLWRGTGISYVKTFLFNISAFDLKTALKFPVWIYQGCIIEHVGNIVIKSTVETGMIRIGKRQFFRSSKTNIINIGTMEFYGNCTILGGTSVHVLGENSVITFGKEVMIGENSKILVGPQIEIGDFSRIAFGTLIMSADFHYLININTGVINRSLAPIKIGKYNWIGNSSIIKKGTITPDYCIVSNASMLTKDYSNEEPYTLLMGCPAKVKGTGFRRVYNDHSNDYLNHIFEHSELKYITIERDDNDPNYDKFCNGEIKVHKH